jgi:hypothetical protein
MTHQSRPDPADSGAVSGARHTFPTPKKGIIIELYNDANRPSTGLRKAIPATCGLHRGPIGFANLMVSKPGQSVALGPQVTGECVITLDEQNAKTLRDTLTE